MSMDSSEWVPGWLSTQARVGDAGSVGRRDEKQKLRKVQESKLGRERQVWRVKASKSASLLHEDDARSTPQPLPIGVIIYPSPMNIYTYQYTCATSLGNKARPSLHLSTIQINTIT